MADIKAFFEQRLPSEFAADPSRAEGMSGTYEFNIAGDGGGVWTVALDGGLKVTVGECADAQCKIKATSEDWGTILNKELDPTTAFMTGKLMIEGDMGMAMKLQPLLGSL